MRKRSGSSEQEPTATYSSNEIVQQGQSSVRLSGREVLEAREHFFVHGNVPHMAVVLLLGEAAGGGARQRPPGPDPGEALLDDRKGLYRALRTWRSERAISDGVPSDVIARNVQLAEICKRLPRTRAELKDRGDRRGDLREVRARHPDADPAEPARSGAGAVETREQGHPRMKSYGELFDRIVGVPNL